MKINAHTITNEQISNLQATAGRAGDVKMAAIAELAIKSEIDGDDWGWERAADRKAVEAMTQDEAIEACVEAINDASKNR